MFNYLMYDFKNNEADQEFLNTSSKFLPHNSIPPPQRMFFLHTNQAQPFFYNLYT